MNHLDTGLVHQYEYNLSENICANYVSFVLHLERVDWRSKFHPAVHVTDWECVALTHMQNRELLSTNKRSFLWDHFCSRHSPKMRFDLKPQHHDYNKYQTCLQALGQVACTLWHFIIHSLRFHLGTLSPTAVGENSHDKPCCLSKLSVQN